MICISVTPESRQLAKVDILNAARQCDLVELCLDRLLKEPDVKDLIEGSQKPVLVSCRTPEDGGMWKGSPEERINLLKQAIIAGPAYVELDSDTARKIPRFGKVKRVISYTSLNRPLGDLEAAFDEAGVLQADVIKFTWPTDQLEAAWPLLAAVSQKRSIPVVGLGLGRSGLTFSLLGRKYGSPWIYAALEKGMEAFPGQITVTELDGTYRWREITPKTRFVGIGGFGTTEQALSTVLNSGFDQLEQNTRCLPLDFRSTEQLPKMLDILKVPAIISTSAAATKVLGLSERNDDVARAASYGDLMLKQPEGWQGYNLIWKTCLKTLEDTLGKHSAEERPLDRRNVMIIGAGGLAHSLALGVKKRGGLVSICAGDDDDARQVAQQVDARFIAMGKLYDTLFDVLVVTVPNLDHGRNKAALMPSIIRPGMVVLDVSELPNETPFIEEAKLRSARIVPPREVFNSYVASMFKAVSGHDLPDAALTTEN